MERKITIGGRELTLLFDTAAWIDVEAAFGNIDAMYQRMAKGQAPITTGLMLASFVATSGTCSRDKKETVSLRWLVKHASPKEARKLITMAKEAVVEGLEMQEDLFEEDGPVDVGLEEESAKKTRADA